MLSRDFFDGVGIFGVIKPRLRVMDPYFLIIFLEIIIKLKLFIVDDYLNNEYCLLKLR